MKRNEKSLLCVVLSGLTGILVFLVILMALGYLASYFHNVVLLGIVSLLVNNLSLIITAGVLFIVADIFYTFHFPFSIPAPIIGGIGSILVVRLLFILLDFFDRIYVLGISDLFFGMQYIFYLLIFIIVVITGYIHIISSKRVMCREDRGADPCCPGCQPGKSWDEVGDEIRQSFHDFFTGSGKK